MVENRYHCTVSSSYRAQNGIYILLNLKRRRIARNAGFEEGGGFIVVALPGTVAVPRDRGLAKPLLALRHDSTGGSFLGRHFYLLVKGHSFLFHVAFKFEFYWRCIQVMVQRFHDS